MQLIQGMCKGYAAWIGNVAEDDAVLVKLLERAGAVLYVRTNLPQTIMVRCVPDRLQTGCLTTERSGQRPTIMSSDVPSILTTANSRPADHRVERVR